MASDEHPDASKNKCLTTEDRDAEGVVEGSVDRKGTISLSERPKAVTEGACLCILSSFGLEAIKQEEMSD